MLCTNINFQLMDLTQCRFSTFQRNAENQNIVDSPLPQFIHGKSFHFWQQNYRRTKRRRNTHDKTPQIQRNSQGDNSTENNHKNHLQCHLILFKHELERRIPQVAHDCLSVSYLPLFVSISPSHSKPWTSSRFFHFLFYSPSFSRTPTIHW